MKRWLYFLVAVFLTACSAPSSSSNASKTALPTTQPSGAGYPNLGPAPELAGEVWLNTETPLRLADLRGKVVLIDMWTYG